MDFQWFVHVHTVQHQRLTCTSPTSHEVQVCIGVGRPDGANTMIKTIQHLAEADDSRVLVALHLKAAFQNVSRSAMLYSNAQTDADLAAVFSKWHAGKGCTTVLPTPISVPTAGWIRVVLCQRVDFQLPLTPYSIQFWRNFAHITTHALNSLPIWTTGTSVFYRQSLSSQQPPDQSTLLCSPPRHRCGKTLARTHSTGFSRQSHTHTQLLGRTSTDPWRH